MAPRDGSGTVRGERKSAVRVASALLGGKCGDTFSVPWGIVMDRLSPHLGWGDKRASCGLQPAWRSFYVSTQCLNESQCWNSDSVYHPANPVEVTTLQTRHRIQDTTIRSYDHISMQTCSYMIIWLCLYRSCAPFRNKLQSCLT